MGKRRPIPTEYEDIQWELKNSFVTPPKLRNLPTHLQRWEDFEREVYYKLPLIATFEHVDQIHRLFKCFWNFSLGVMEKAITSLEEIDIELDDDLTQCRNRDYDFRVMLNKMGIHGRGEVIISLETMLKFMNGEFMKRQRNFQAKLRGKTLRKLWEDLPGKIAEWVEPLLLNSYMYVYEGQQVYPNACWAPQPFMIRMLWEASGFWEPRFKARLPRVLDVVRHPHYSFINADGEPHYGEVFHDVVKLLQAGGRMSDLQFNRFIKGYGFASRNGVETYDWLSRPKRFKKFSEWGRFTSRYAWCRVSVMRQHAKKYGETTTLSAEESVRLEVDKSSYLTAEIQAVYKLTKCIAEAPGFSNAINLAYVWFEAGFKRLPSNPKLVGVLAESGVLKFLKPHWKFFQRGLIWCQSTKFESTWSNDIPDHMIIALAQLSIWFQGEIISRLKDMGGNPHVIHDKGINLTNEPSTEVVRRWFIRETRKHPDSWMDYVRVANQATLLNDRLNIQVGAKGTSLKTCLEALKSLVYSDVEFFDLALEAAKWGYSQEEFSKLQKMWTTVGHNEYESIPYVQVIDSNYKFSKLDRMDVRGIFLGEYTNCCQHPRSVGRSCAMHGAINPDGSFFVVERSGRIIAQSWAWRNGDVVVMDNIEVLGNCPPQIIKLYLSGAEQMIGKLGIKEVHVGMGGNDCPEIERLCHVQRTVSQPRDCYSDYDSPRMLACVKP